VTEPPANLLSSLTATNFLTAQSTNFAPPFDFAAHFPSDNCGKASNCKYFERQHEHRLGGASGIVASACYNDQEGSIVLHPANTHGGPNFQAHSWQFA
jgi:hypothetical protein